MQKPNINYDSPTLNNGYLTARDKYKEKVYHKDLDLITMYLAKYESLSRKLEETEVLIPGCYFESYFSLINDLCNHPEVLLKYGTWGNLEIDIMDGWNKKLIDIEEHNWLMMGLVALVQTISKELSKPIEAESRLPIQYRN